MTEDFLPDFIHLLSVTAELYPGDVNSTCAG